jgi:hypothetical protein
MNGEVSLIVRVGGDGVAPGPTILETGGGYVDLFSTPQTVNVSGDETDWQGGYVEVISTLNGSYGLFYCSAAVYDGSVWTVLTLDGYPFLEMESVTFNFYGSVPASTEYYLDLFENESISQNWRYTDLNNFTSLGAFSREFRVPYSDRNQLALGALFDVNYDGGLNNFFHYKLPAEIRVDTLPIAKGYIRVRKVYQQMGKINEIELAFYAETPDLFKAIGEKKLKDIEDLPNLNETVIYDNVTITTSARIWTLVDRGQLWSEQGQAGTRRISNSATPLYAVDLTPALRWDYLLEQIIADAGFELEAASLLNILAGYHMPWINKSYLDTDDLGPQYAFRAYNASTITMPFAPSGSISPYQYYAPVSEAFDNNNDYDPTTGVYTAPGGGLYTFHFTLALQSLNYAGVGNFTIFKIYYRVNGGTPIFIEDFGYSANLTVDFLYGMNLEAGDTVEFAFRYEIVNAGGAGSGIADVYILAGSGDLGSSLIELVGTRFNYGSTIAYNLNAPDMRQADFVNDVIKMHNCVIVPDRINPNKISIVPYNSYIGSGDVLDWNQKLDIGKDITIYSTTELQKAKTLFSYTAGEDYLGKLYKDNGRVYGEYKVEGYSVNPDVPISTFVQGDNTVQLVTRSTPAGNIPGTLIPIPQFLNNNNEFVVPGPRALFAANAYQIQLFDDSIGVQAPVAFGVTVLNNYSSVTATITDYDLNFAPETPPFIINANPYFNLFNTYWRNAFNELYSPNARIMEASFALDLSDILTFKFSDIIHVQNAQWRILEITDYKVGMFESTKVKLIKYIDSEADCASTPDTININGTVNFIDGNGDPVAATQSCCVRYGYTWSESAGECYSFNNQGSLPTNGITGTNTNPISRNVIAQTVDGNSRSVQQGVELSIVDGNNNMIAVGDTLKLTESVNGNSMFGKNVLTSQSGFHLGGGWKLDDRGQNEGGTQYGIIMLGSKDALAISGDIIQPTIDNTGVHLSIPDDSFWSVLLHINVTDTATQTTYNALHMVTLQKVGSIAAATGAILISEDNGFGTVNFAINIDTATNTAEHRIEIVTTGTGYPYTFFTTVTLQYTAVR